MDNYDQQFIARDVELVNRYEFYEATAASQNVLSSSTRDLVAPPIEFPGRTWSGTNHFDTLKWLGYFLSICNGNRRPFAIQGTAL